MDRDDKNVKAYEGGSFRENIPGKGIYAAMSSVALKRVARRYEYGELKYGKSEAYKDGLPVSNCFNSAMRHLVAYLDGDNSEDHLAACIWNCCCMMEMEVNKPKWQDLRNRRRFKKRDCIDYPMYIEEEIDNG